MKKALKIIAGGLIAMSILAFLQGCESCNPCGGCPAPTYNSGCDTGCNR